MKLRKRKTKRVNTIEMMGHCKDYGCACPWDANAYIVDFEEYYYSPPVKY